MPHPTGGDRVLLDANGAVPTAAPEARLVSDLYLQPRAWVHRRVESVSLASTETIHVEATVDFTIPIVHDESAPTTIEALLIPLTLVRKRVHIGLTVTDEIGRALPVLTALESCRRGVEALINVLPDGTWDRVQQHFGGEHNVESRFWDVVARPRDVAQQALPDVMRAIANADVASDEPEHPHRTRLDRAIDAADISEFMPLLRNDDLVKFCMMLRDLAYNLILFTVVMGRSGERRTLKYGHEVSFEGDPVERGHFQAFIVEDETVGAGETRSMQTKGRLRRLAQCAGQTVRQTRPHGFEYPTPSIGSARSYHFEVSAPPGLAIRTAKLRAWEGEDEIPDDRMSYVSHSALVRFRVRNAGRPGTSARALVEFAPERAWRLMAVLLASVFATILTVGFVTASGIGPRAIADPEGFNTAATSLLIVLPAASSAYLAKPSAHPFVAMTLLPAKVGIFLAGLSLYVAAVALVVSNKVNRPIWGTSALLIWLAVGYIMIPKGLRYVRRCWRASAAQLPGTSSQRS